MMPLKNILITTILLQLMYVGISGLGISVIEVANAQSSGTIKVYKLSLDSLKNRVTLTQPDTQYSNSKVYGDTIRAIIFRDKEGILITGNFSNGCTHLKNVHYSPSGDTLKIHLEGWQPQDKMCTQALKPFQYVDTSQNSEWLSQFSFYEFRGH